MLVNNISILIRCTDKLQILRRVDWYFFTDISGQPLAPTFNGQAVQEEFQGAFCAKMIYLLTATG